MLNSAPLAAGAFALAMLPGSPAVGETIDHAATRFNVDQCRHKQGYVSYGPHARREPAATQTLGAPNGEGRSIEWRMVRGPGRKGRPFATIMRWTTAVVADDPKVERGVHRGEVLVVTRLGPGGVCHVGYVDGRQNPDANTLARAIADRHARAFRCGKDKPIMLGDKGPGFSEPYGGGRD